MSKFLFQVTADARIVVNLCLYTDTHSELIAKLTENDAQVNPEAHADLEERIQQQNFLSGIVIQPHQIKSVKPIQWIYSANSPHLHFSYEDEQSGETDCYLPRKLVEAIGEEAAFEVVVGEHPVYLTEACDEQLYNRSGVEWENIVDEWLTEPWATTKRDRPIVLVLVKFFNDRYEMRVGEVNGEVQSEAVFSFESDSEAAALLLESTKEKLEALGHTIQHCIRV